MPRKKVTDRMLAHERAENAKKYVSKISDEFVKKAKQGNLSQSEFNKAAEALRAIVTNSHITGIRATTPKLRIESLDRSNIVVKISIGTAKTRKQFSIRRGL